VAPPLVREHRLYQADWLVRFYGFRADEIAPPDAPNLDLALDPKLAWAIRHRDLFPLDVNRGPRELLLRIPGVGAKSVERILQARRWRRLRVADLAALRVAVRRALPFVVTADHTPSARVLDAADLRERLLARRSRLVARRATCSRGRRPSPPTAPGARPRGVGAVGAARRAVGGARRVVPNVAFDGTLAGWRRRRGGCSPPASRPDDAVWESADDAQGALALGGGSPADPGAPSAAPTASPGASAAARVPRRFLALAALVACHRDPARWGALYRVLWRLTRGGEPRLLAVSVDPDVLRLTRMAKAVRRDEHKMHAFVRFRAVADAGGGEPEYVAWFEPEHDVVARAAPLFARRFPNMRWAILTPRGTARWDGAALSFGPGVPVREGPRDDSLEALWGVYYAHVFNPARVKLAAMRSEMPARLLAEPAGGAADRGDGAGGAGAGAADGRGGDPGGRCGGGGPDGGAAAGGADAVGRTWWGGDVTAGRDAAGGGGAGGGPRAARGGVGWSGGDDAWYPDDARTADGRLRHDAARLPLAEAADAAAALPTRALAALWAARTPPGFVFDVRAHALLAGRPWSRAACRAASATCCRRRSPAPTA
jgi:probable DNA metabolism protein